MREVFKTSEFRKSIKLLMRRHWDLSPLVEVMEKLRDDAPSTELFKDHPLSGNFVGKRECM